MTDDQPAAPGQPGFVRGNERSDQLLADPQLAADVAAAHADAEEMDRVYAMNLAMIRKAAQMTQVEVARKLGVGQGVVSRLEHRDDMLLSTLYDYLMATGAEGAGIVVIVHGHRIELDLQPRNPPEQQSALAQRPCHVTLPQNEYAQPPIGAAARLPVTPVGAGPERSLWHGAVAACGVMICSMAAGDHPTELLAAAEEERPAGHDREVRVGPGRKRTAGRSP